MIRGIGLFIGCLALMPMTASGASIASNIDTQVAESTTDDGSGSGGDAVMNARFNGSINEFIVVRFDLAGVDKSTIASAAIDLTLARTGSNNQKDQRIWGVNSGVAGLNTFDETIIFGTTPGLVTDMDLSTQGVVDADTTFLGTFKNPIDPADMGVNPNAPINTIDQNLLDTTSFSETTEATIAGYLQSLDTADQAVFLIGGAGASSGQFRIVTTEGGSAPVLQYELVPEPASLALLGLAAAGLAARRRRA